MSTDVAHGLTAWGPFAENRDVPDVLGFADFSARPEETYRLVRARLDDDTLFADAAYFPLPKVNGSLRSLAILNPIDEMAVRTYVGRVAPAVARAIDSERVLNGLFVNPGPGWFSADFREQSIKRRDLQRSLYNDDRCGAVGFVDVKNFFKSCAHDVLGRLLVDLGAPPGAVAVLQQMLLRLYPSEVGLPIGFEGSGPLANVLLRGVDNALADLGVPFVRWTDDIDIFLNRPEQWLQAYGLVEDALGEALLRPNELKTEMRVKGPAAEHRLLDPGRDSIFDDDAESNIRDILNWEQWMKDWVDADSSDIPPGHFRSIVGYLRKQEDPAAIEYLRAFPDWIYREPKAVGWYLAAMLANAKTRKEVDIDWAVSLATAEPERKHVAGQLHLMRAVSAMKLDREHGAQLRDFALDKEVLVHFPALGAWSTMAWARSHAWKAQDAMDVAASVGHLSYQRAALAGFADRAPAPAVASGLKRMARHVPQLGPVVDAVALG